MRDFTVVGGVRNPFEVGEGRQVSVERLRIAARRHLRPRRKNERDRNPVPERNDRRRKALVGKRPAEVLADPLGRWVFVVGVRHAAEPEGVVGDDEASFSDAPSGEFQAVGVLFFVHVDVDEVPGASSLRVVARKDLPRVADLETAPLGKPCAGEVLPGAFDVSLVAVGENYLAVGTHGPCEKERRVAEARSHLEDAPCTDRPREREEKPPDEGTHDRKVPLGGEFFHLGLNRTGLRMEGGEVGGDGVVEDRHVGILLPARTPVKRGPGRPQAGSAFLLRGAIRYDRGMRVGLQVTSFTSPGASEAIRPTLAEVARAAEANGLASLWVMDHFFQIPPVGPPEEPMLEAYTTLGYLAGVTEKIRLGCLVTGVVYREPALLAKAATTLDVLSGGRAYLGIGAAWFEREAVGLGFPFPPIAERFERLEEALQIIQAMWNDERRPFAGKHYRLAETMGVPRPLQKPRPAILIGGRGEKKTLRLVARYADACNLFLHDGPDVLRHQLDVLRRHCDEAGRDYDAVEKTVLGTFRGNAGETVRTCRELAGLGFSHAIFNIPNVHEIAPVEALGREVAAKVADL